MKAQRLIATAMHIAGCVALAACGGSDSDGVEEGAVGSSGAGATSGAAGTAAGGSIAIGGAGVAGSSQGVAGQAPAGGSMSAGAMSASGTGATAGSSGAAGSAMSGAGGQAAGADGGAEPGGTASTEDEGADCTVPELPDADSLPEIALLPDPFEKLDGTRIASKSEWRCRRQEIKRMAETYALGVKPPPPESVTGDVSESSITVDVMDNGQSTSFSVSVDLPSGGEAPYPAIVVYGGFGFGAPLDSNIINSEGIALITYNPFDAGSEGTPRNNKQGAFYDLYGSNSTTGLLVAWGWGVSRIIDVIEKSDGSILDAEAVGVTGCSRFGKGAFIAGVFDQRIALTLPIESGTAGVPIWRGIPGEGAQSLSSGYGEQPWFGDAFGDFTSNPTRLPIDTHELVAMIAPRGLFVMDNPHIANLGPRSAHVAALAGAEVYAALGAGENISYWSDEQDGGHCAVRPEWSAPLRSSIQRFLNKTDGEPGVIQAASKARGELSQWRDWETPALQ